MRSDIEIHTVRTSDGRLPVRPDRATARLVGVLFILATAAGVASVVLQQPVVDVPDYLSEARHHEGRLATAALMEIVMSFAVAAIAVAIYPVLARFRARLAIGYVVARAAEGTLYLIASASLLTLLTLRRTGSSAKDLVDLVLTERTMTATVIGTAAFSVSAVLLYAVLLRARLVPRWLSGWGLVAALLYVAGGVMGVYGADSDSTAQTALDLPLALQEMTMAGWLIIRGFTRATDVPAVPSVAGAPGRPA